MKTSRQKIKITTDLDYGQSAFRADRNRTGTKSHGGKKIKKIHCALATRTSKTIRQAQIRSFGRGVVAYISR